ncbi:hypothetical protein B0H11DRAFT_2182879 [Mycena galericulata]|nr:hypothetical protein B0H11DRAFT_2182879 [Mycena galericulata]
MKNSYPPPPGGFLDAELCTPHEILDVRDACETRNLPFSATYVEKFSSPQIYCHPQIFNETSSEFCIIPLREAEIPAQSTQWRRAESPLQFWNGNMYSKNSKEAIWSVIAPISRAMQT